jgi:hypothetical protein
MPGLYHQITRGNYIFDAIHKELRSLLLAYNIQNICPAIPQFEKRDIGSKIKALLQI